MSCCLPFVTIVINATFVVDKEISSTHKTPKIQSTRSTRLAKTAQFWYRSDHLYLGWFRTISYGYQNWHNSAVKGPDLSSNHIPTSWILNLFRIASIRCIMIGHRSALNNGSSLALQQPPCRILPCSLPLADCLNFRTIFFFGWTTYIQSSPSPRNKSVDALTRQF